MDLIDKEPHEIVDMFIGDCLLPTTDAKKRMKASELYDIFLIYCEQIGIAPPVNIVGLGRRLSKRLQAKRHNTGVYYFCEFKPNLFEGVDVR